MATREHVQTSPAILPKAWSACLWNVHMHTCLRNGDSNALLQRSHSEGLDNLLGWLCFHHHHLAKHLPLASLRRGLRLHLQHREAWDGELASGFDFLRGYGCETSKRLLAICRFQAGGCCDRRCDARLGHGRHLHGSLRCHVSNGLGSGETQMIVSVETWQP